MKCILQRSQLQVYGLDNSSFILKHNRNYHIYIIVYVINSKAFDMRKIYSVLAKRTIYGVLFKKTSLGNEVESSHLSSRAELEAVSSVQKWIFVHQNSYKYVPQ